MIEKMVSVELPEDKKRKNSLLAEELADGKVLISGVASKRFLRDCINALVEAHNQTKAKEEPKLCVITAFQG